MARPRPTGLLALLLLGAVAGCSVEYECADACRKVYDRCDSAVEVDGVALAAEQCELICEEGRGAPQGGAALWLDCVEDSVCPGDVADEEDRDLRRYDVTWCNPQFESLIIAM
ncbi:MAG TPA: hypothetical protein VNO33_12865 [Kofleriaceae bacterium]|nr:hypothetical protein [Kofleriaceae bacterium]